MLRGTRFRPAPGDLCTYASFFKINEFHIHASDNLWDPAFLYGAGNEGWKHLYAAVRFQPPANSPIAGLVPRKNESWTQTDFKAMQTRCAARGVRGPARIGRGLTLEQRAAMRGEELGDDEPGRDDVRHERERVPREAERDDRGGRGGRGRGGGHDEIRDAEDAGCDARDVDEG